MERLEEDLKNKISFNMEKIRSLDGYEFSIYNPLNLNITDNFDLIEKLTTLFIF